MKSDLGGHRAAFRLVPEVEVVGRGHRYRRAGAHLAQRLDQHRGRADVVGPEDLRLVAHAHGSHDLRVGGRQADGAIDLVAVGHAVVGGDPDTQQDLHREAVLAEIRGRGFDAARALAVAMGAVADGVEGHGTGMAKSW
jgi:hypothetical protein